MGLTIRRLLLLGSVAWFAFWGYVGWRGWDQTRDAEQFINSVKPGQPIPLAVLEALEAGQTHVRETVLFGALVPVVVLLVWWIIGPTLRERRSLG